MTRILSGTVYQYAEDAVPNSPGNYFEIGVFNGLGFSEIARKNPSKTCYAVDPFIEGGHTVASSGVETGNKLNQQKLNFLDCTKDLSNVVLYETTSYNYSQQLTDEQCNNMNISIVTIDGDHHYENVVIDFDIAVRLIGNKPGKIIVDDTDVVGVARAFEEFKVKFAHRIIDEHRVVDHGSTQVLTLREQND